MSGLLRVTLNRFKVRNDLPFEVIPTPGRFAVLHSRHQIIVHEFIRVQFRRVTRKKEQLDVSPMFCQPGLYSLAVMHSQIIKD